MTLHQLNHVLMAIGLIASASWLCWRVEQLGQLHPSVRLGVQVGLVGASGYALARMAGIA